MSRSRLTRAARAAVLAAAAAFACGLAVAPVQAAAPQVRTQAPGWFRMPLGDFEVTALSDGFFDLPVDKILKQPAARTDAALARAFLKLPLETSVNGFLVNTGSRLVLIDTGTGGLEGPTAGSLVANLRAAGYAPEQVDDVLITHDHGDHAGGLAHDGAAVFPNATIHVGKGDLPHYTDAAAGDKIAFAAAAPYVAAHRLQPIEADGEIVPGIRAWGTPGHTPGHTSYVVESKGERLIVTGDLIHVAAVQMDDPTVTVSFDTDERAAESQRLKVFGQAAREGTWIAAAHLQFPGIGHLRADGKGYRFVPVNYLHQR
ncbi:MAG: MBL fold metallo-hydrolase [Burkholderiaceae bacterium]